MIKNKKAIIGESFQDITALGIIVFLLLIFFIFSKLIFGWTDSNIKEAIEQERINSQSHYALQALLQKPVSVNYNGIQQTMQFSDLIKLGSIDANYNSIIELEVKNSLDSAYNYKFNKNSGSIFFIPSKTPINATLEIIKTK